MKLILFLLVLLFLIVPVNAVDWHDESRLKRVQLNVNNSSVALTDYQLMKNITYDDDMQSDFDDLLFYNESGGSVPYWIESKTDSSIADVWVKVPSISTTEGAQVWMYYDNSSVSGVSSISGTMIFGDDFGDASIDTSKWTTTGSNVVESGGTLQITGNSLWDGNGITSDVTFDRSSQGYIMAFRVKTSVASGYKIFGYGPQPLNVDNGLYNYWDDGGGGTGRWRARYDGSSGTPFIDPIAADTWYYSELLLKQTQGYTFFVDGTQYDDDSSFADNNHRVNINQYSSGQTIYTDYCFIRQYTTTEPTWGTDGEEESYEAPPPALNGTYLYPNSTYSIGYYGSLTSELVYETGINFSDLYTFNLLSAENMEYLSTDDTNYIPSIDKDAAHDGYMYGNFSLHGVESVNFINVKTVHNRIETNPVILGLFNVSTQKWHAVNNSSVEIVDVELTYNITGTDILKYTTLEDNVLNLSVSLNTNGDGNYDVFVDFVEVYVDYEEVPCLTLECVYNLAISNQNNISVLQNDVGDLESNVNNLYLFVLLCTVFLIAASRKRREQ